MLDLLPAFVCGLRLMLGKSCGLDPPPFPVNRQHCRQFSSCAPSGGSGNATFPQLVDHSTPQLGTFEQFFYWNTNSWDERNWRQAPIILYLGADHSIQDLDQNINGDDSLVAKLAETVGGAIIYLEHRYWGSSSPFEIGTTSNLQYLTIEQALEDVTHFKENVELPFLTNAQNRLADTPGSNNPPWILIGGGYAGALTVWTAQRTKDHFWAFVASSPVMIAQERFSQFDRAAIEYGPKNCTRDVVRVVEYVDNILEHGTRNEISALKSKFGLESLRDDDFAFVLHIGPLQWTEASISRDFSYMEFCDHVEGIYGQMNPHIHIPDEYGVGLERAISGYAMYVESLKRHCEGAGYGAYQGRGNNTRCWDTYEPLNPKFTDITINDGAVRRQWKWLTCNEPYASWPAPPLEGQPSLMSRFVTPGRYARECRLTFPAGEGEGFGLKSGPTFEEFNRKYNGRNISDHDQKLIISHGRMDPYFALSDLSPDGSLDQTTSQTRRFVHPGGSRDDLFLSSGRDHPEMKAVQDAELDQLANWISEYRSDSQRP